MADLLPLGVMKKGPRMRTAPVGTQYSLGNRKVVTLALVQLKQFCRESGFSFHA
jgi:hypothetical protein